MILCVIDLPNINFLATGSIDKLIKLWDLRASAIDQTSVVHEAEDRTSAKVSTQTFVGAASQKRSAIQKKSVVGSKKAGSSKVKSQAG